MPTMNHTIQAIHHVSLLVHDLDRSKNFYLNLLGLELDLSRPNKGFEGVWINVGQQQIHLIVEKEAGYQTVAEAYGGRTRHFAMTLKGLDSVIKALEQAEIQYSASRSGRPVVFCRDPDGNVLELIEQSD